MKLFLPACLFVSLMALPTHADIIYFKDGMKTVCQQKAWEQDGEVKCEYGGWVISYQKKDVLRIVKTIPEKKLAPPKTKKQNTPQTASVTAPAIKKPRALNPGSLAFYDPRRPYKYWASKNSKHKTFKKAVDALAKQYGQSPSWIQAHMGDSNDLAQIHLNLAHPDTSQHVASAKAAAKTPPGIVFYNPRRVYPYWTGRSAKYKTFKAAINSLASQFNRSAQWIQANMGSTNNLNEIRKNLISRKTAEAGD